MAGSPGFAFVNRCRFLTSSTGNGTSLTIGAALAGGFFTPSGAGAVDGQSYRYLIEQPATGDIEVNYGAYSSSAGTFVRGTPEQSTNGGSRINIATGAMVTLLPSAADFNAFALITDTRSWQTTGTLVSGGGQRSLRATTSGTGAVAYDYITDSGNANLLGYWTYSNQTAAWSANLTANGSIVSLGGVLQANSTSPYSQLYQTNGATDGKYWRMIASGGNLYFDLVNDAYNAASGWLTVTRSGTTPTGVFFGCTIAPAIDAGASLGSASNRWNTVYASAGTINTSDEEQKTDILPIDDWLLDAWASVEWLKFRMREAVDGIPAEVDDTGKVVSWAAKPKGNAARWHFGLVAQRVRDALAKHKDGEGNPIDGRRYGLLCFDKWDAVERQHVDAVPEVEAVEGVPKLDDDGEVIGWEVEPVAYQPAQPAIDIPGRAAGEAWGLRYLECEAVESAYQRRRADRAEGRLDAIEARLAKLEEA